MDSQYKLLSELLLDQAAFITPPETSLANYWGGHCPLPPCPPVSTGLLLLQHFCLTLSLCVSTIELIRGFEVNLRPCECSKIDLNE